MPTAVLDLDLTKLSPQIAGLEEYSEAFILIRYKGKPVGKIVLPVTAGTLQLHQYYDVMLHAVEPAYKQAWLRDYLEWQEDTTTDFVLPKATIAICTRNRTDDLRRCLDALMQLPDDGQEILVVDNCPSDNHTRELVATYPQVRYVLEERKGLNFARNTALTSASHDIVAFTDDDAAPDKNWLRSLLRNFNHSLVLCVTGMTMPLELETDAQLAFEKYSPFGKGFKRKVHTPSSGNPLATGGIGAGANMAFRKSVMQLVGKFDEALDAGTATQSGGDHDYFARILLAGYHIVYEPEALSWHRHRRTWQETKQAIKGYGIGVYAYWTKLLFAEGEWGIVKLPYGWFVHTQLPNIVKSVLRRPHSQPLSLLLAELHGCFLGPWKYYAAKRHLHNKR
jgi:glycosyltransferase involved in cell wall biosynthesis